MSLLIYLSLSKTQLALDSHEIAEQNILERSRTTQKRL